MQGAQVEGGIGVLLERGHLAFVELHHVGKRGAEALSGRLVGTTVLSEHHHGAPVGDKLARDGGKPLPLGSELHKDILQHRLRPVRDTTIGPPFGLGPANIGGEHPQHRGYIAYWHRHHTRYVL